MQPRTCFIFDLGDTVIKLAYERVIAAICSEALMSRDELVHLLEQPGGYRDLERGAVSFWEFYEFLCEYAGYHGSIRDMHDAWCDFFDGPIPGMEELLDRVRAQHRLAFLSNSNQIHAELIPRRFPNVVRKNDQLILSHELHVAKPDPDIFIRTLNILEATPSATVFVDDMLENVRAAQSVGIRAIQFRGASELIQQLESEGWLTRVA